MDFIQNLFSGVVGGIVISTAWAFAANAWEVFQLKKVIDNAGDEYILKGSNKLGLSINKNFLSKIKDKDLKLKVLASLDSQGDKANQGWDKGIRGEKVD